MSSTDHLQTALDSLEVVEERVSDGIHLDNNGLLLHALVHLQLEQMGHSRAERKPVGSIQLDDYPTVIVPVPPVPYKGPLDTDAEIFRTVASRLERNQHPGGSNARQTVAKLLRYVSAALEQQHPAAPAERVVTLTQDS